MLKRIKYGLWGLNQLFSIIKACFMVEPKRAIFTNLFKLIHQQANLRVTFNGNLKIFLRDFFDLLAFYEVFVNKSYKRLFSEKSSVPVTFIDIGAYNGDSSIFADKYKYVNKIISIEPHPDNFHILEKNIRLNKVKAALMNMAVSNSKNVIMYVYKNRRQTGIHANGVRREKFIIKSVRLKELVNNINGKIFVKCDTEGAEFDIFLRTPIKTLRKIDRVMIEYHSKYQLISLINHLKKSGMSVTAVNNRLIDGFGYIYGSR